MQNNFVAIPPLLPNALSPPMYQLPQVSHSVVLAFLNTVEWEWTLTHAQVCWAFKWRDIECLQSAQAQEQISVLDESCW